MAWTLQSDRPIYAQLVERLKTEIVSGVYPPGGRLPSVRELAATASVNPNTMQKAFAELERTGLIITMRTSGRVVTEDTAMINETRRELAEEQISHFLTQMNNLGFDRAEIIAMLSEHKGGDSHE